MRVKKKSRFWIGAIAFLLLVGMLAGKNVQAAEKKVAKVSLGNTHSFHLASGPAALSKQTEAF